MRAFAVFPDRRAAEVVEVDAPELTSSSGVQMRVLDVGICGTDREISEWQYGESPSDCEYLILGHESLCEVVAVGTDVSGFSPGDLVVPSVRRPCTDEHCTACQSGLQDFCYTGGFRERGIKQLHGFLAEQVVEESAYLTLVPGKLREVGVLVEPLTIAEKALEQIWRVQQRLPWACAIAQGDGSTKNSGPTQGCTALVLGAGPVGLLGAMALVESGFHTYVYSREPQGGPRSQIVANFDAHYLSAEDVAIDDLDQLLSGIDVVYEATGASALAFDVLSELGTNGVFVFTGVPGRKHEVKVETGTIMRDLVLKNQVVFGTVNASAGAFSSAVARLERFVDRWPGVVESLIARRWSLEEVPTLLTEPGPGVKHVVRLQER